MGTFLWGPAPWTGMIRRYVGLKRGDSIANVGIPGEHSRTKVPRQLTVRFLGDGGFFASRVTNVWRAS